MTERKYKRRFFDPLDPRLDTLYAVGELDAQCAMGRGLSKFYNPEHAFDAEYRRGYDIGYEEAKFNLEGDE